VGEHDIKLDLDGDPDILAAVEMAADVLDGAVREGTAVRLPNGTYMPREAFERERARADQARERGR
jgi:hypothetical protein